MTKAMLRSPLRLAAPGLQIVAEGDVQSALENNMHPKRGAHSKQMQENTRKFWQTAAGSENNDPLQASIRPTRLLSIPSTGKPCVCRRTSMIDLNSEMSHNSDSSKQNHAGATSPPVFLTSKAKNVDMQKDLHQRGRRV